MYKVLASILVLLVANVASRSTPESRIYEDALTVLLQDSLAKFDPLTIKEVINSTYITEKTRIKMNITDMVLTGLGKTVVAEFNYNEMLKVMKIMYFMMELTTTSDHYKLNGTFDGHRVTGEGKVSIKSNKILFGWEAETVRVSIEPPAICFKEGTLATGFGLEFLEVDLEGQEDMSKDLTENGVDSVNKIVNESLRMHAKEMLAGLNKLYCNE